QHLHKLKDPLRAQPLEGRDRHPHSPGPARSPGREQDDDLPPRPDPWAGSGAKPRRSSVPGVSATLYRPGSQDSKANTSPAIRRYSVILRPESARHATMATGATPHGSLRSPCYVVQDSYSSANTET